jgi:hypothetical protein
MLHIPFLLQYTDMRDISDYVHLCWVAALQSVKEVWAEL